MAEENEITDGTIEETAPESRLSGDFIDSAAPLNLRDDLTPEQRENAIANKTDRFERMLKSREAGDRMRAYIEAQEKGVWTAEALATQEWSLLNPMTNLKFTATLGVMGFANFVNVEAGLSEAAATMRYWEENYAAKPGSEITTIEDLSPEVVNSWREYHEEERARDVAETRERLGLGGTDIQSEFADSAADSAEPESTLEYAPAPDEFAP